MFLNTNNSLDVLDCFYLVLLGCKRCFICRSKVTPIHFGNGTLRDEFSTWIGNDETGDPRKKLEIPDPDVPTEFVGSTVVDSRSSEFVTFDATSARKDVSSWLTRSCDFLALLLDSKVSKLLLLF